jgi:O-methyltransferase
MEPRDIARKFLGRSANGTLWQVLQRVAYPPDFTDEQIKLWRAVRDYTMTSPERVIGLQDAVRSVVTNAVPGALVECGVWRGGSSMVMALTLRELGETFRDIFLFDTFEGMVDAGPEDRSHAGKSARDLLRKTRRSTGKNIWCIATLDDVRANLVQTGYPPERLHLIPGKVEDTIPAEAPEQIALLRLDTDWYESTRHELLYLYERVSPGGLVIIDDYGHWEGARKATEEFVGTLRPRPILFRLDYTGRAMIKPG